MNLSALIRFAQRLLEIRKGERGEHAAATFLMALSPTVVLLLGLMADAASLTLELIRSMDPED